MRCGIIGRYNATHGYYVFIYRGNKIDHMEGYNDPGLAHQRNDEVNDLGGEWSAYITENVRSTKREPPHSLVTKKY